MLIAKGKKKEKEKEKKKLVWPLMWLNKSVVTINTTL